MKELLNQAEIDVTMVPKVSSKAVISAMLGVDEPDNVLIGNPNLIKVKGTGCFSRMKPVAEVIAKELAKRRTYSMYGGKEGQNKRTCTNEPASKKPKVQVAPKEKAAPKQQASQPRRFELRSSIGYIKKDKNKAKLDKTKHGNGKSKRRRSRRHIHP
ncbi:hypothetical protein Tco_0559892 [Tanacetum coccineum]